MAQRWSINEDIIIYKYCIEIPGAYNNMEDIELMAAKLNEAGYEARSNRAIQYRAYSFKILLENRQLPYISEQVVMVYNKLTRENERISQEIKSYIREVYKPQEATIYLEKPSLLSSLTKEPSGLLEMQRAIDYNSTFPMVLQKYVDLKGIKKHNAMCKAIGMKPDTFSAILRGKYKEVKKDNVLKLCVGLKLRVKEAEELLESAGYMFSNGVMRDVVIKAFLWDGIYSVVAINAELYENNEDMLFENYVIEYEV